MRELEESNLRADPTDAPKIVVLGLDAAVPLLIDEFIGDGVLPNLAAVIEDGVLARHYTTFPTLTSPAWNALSTGGGIGTTGIPSLTVKLPGEPLDTLRSCFDTRYVEAETLWDAAGRAGRRTVLVNWPVTWPPKPLHGVQIAGSINPPFRFYYMPIHDLSPACVFSTEKLPCDQEPGRAIQVEISDDDGAGRSFRAYVSPSLEDRKHYRVTLLADAAGRYDRMRIVPEIGSTTAHEPVELRVGEQSDWITQTFRPGIAHSGDHSGDIRTAANSAGRGSSPRRGRYRFYLSELSPTGETVKLYISSVATGEPLTIPAEHAEAVHEAAGQYWEVDDPWAYLNGWVPLEFYMHQLEELTDWWGKATLFAVEQLDFELLFSWIGSIDHIQHVLWGGVDEAYRWFDPDQKDRYLALLREVYARVDHWVGRIRAAMPDDAILACVSDHGFAHVTQYVFLLQHFKDCGLAEYRMDGDQVVVDWEHTKAYPLPPGHNHIFVNLRGRDPQGCVEPEDYERVQDEIISCLYSIRDPDTDQLITSLALRRQEARTLGIHENAGFDRIGDVLYAFHNGYCTNPLTYPARIEYPDGTHKYIPNAEGFEPAHLHRHFTGYHVSLPSVPEMEGMLAMAGPGTAKGRRLETPIDVVDIVPTWAYLIGVPVPRDAEGGALSTLLDHELRWQRAGPGQTQTTLSSVPTTTQEED